MPRVFRLINRLNIGGPTYNAAILSKELAPRYDTLLVSGMIGPGEASSAHIVEALGLQPRLIPYMYREISPTRDWRGYRELSRVLREYQPQIVHTHAAKAGVRGRLAAFAHNVPVVVHTFHGHVFHSYFSPLKTQAFIRIERMLAGLSDAIIALSPLQAYELSEVFRIAPRNKIQIIPNGFDLTSFTMHTNAKRAAFRQKYGLTDDVVGVGIVGRLVPIKNHALFLEGFARMKRTATVPVRAFIIGDGELRTELEALCRQLGLSYDTGAGQSDIVFTSWIQDVSEPVAGLDIIALTSLNEGNPVSLVEAQAGARAVVSTDVGGVRDTVLPDRSGLVVPTQDSEALATALHRLVHQPELRLQMGETGQRFALQKFSWQRLVTDMDALYTRLLAAKNLKV
ncbi:MAG: glycosyltransferase [Bacteroidetes bacterium]|nr:glycosyltransferase [Bacteroidota bacterium]